MSVSNVNSGFPSPNALPDPSLNGALPLASRDESMPADALGLSSNSSGAGFIQPQV